MEEKMHILWSGSVYPSLTKRYRQLDLPRIEKYTGISYNRL